MVNQQDQAASEFRTGLGRASPAGTNREFLVGQTGRVAGGRIHCALSFGPAMIPACSVCSGFLTVWGKRAPPKHAPREYGAGSRIPTRQESRRTHAQSVTPQCVCLVASTAARDTECRAAAATEHRLELPLPSVEVEFPHGLPLPGAQTSMAKVVAERRLPAAYILELEGPAESSLELPLRLNISRVQVRGAKLTRNRLHIRFPQGASYRRVSVQFSW